MNCDNDALNYKELYEDNLKKNRLLNKILSLNKNENNEHLEIMSKYN